MINSTCSHAGSWKNWGLFRKVSFLKPKNKYDKDGFLIKSGMTGAIIALPQPHRKPKPTPLACYTFKPNLFLRRFQNNLR